MSQQLQCVGGTTMHQRTMNIIDEMNDLQVLLSSCSHNREMRNYYHVVLTVVCVLYFAHVTAHVQVDTLRLREAVRPSVF